jgi:hypothetical protein
MGMDYGIDCCIDILDVVDIAVVVGTVAVVLCFGSKSHNQFVG